MAGLPARNSVLEQASWPFLAGGGEMGAKMRMLDWSATEIGTSESWPQSSPQRCQHPASVESPNLPLLGTASRRHL